jgi:pyrimidine operon attenuation protein / uracil phosphoribosyltransferase
VVNSDNSTQSPLPERNRAYKSRIRQLMNEDGMSRALEEIAAGIFRRYSSVDSLLCMGMATRGVNLAERLAGVLGAKFGEPVPNSVLDTTFYRDDQLSKKSLGKSMSNLGAIPPDVEGKDIILVDDVLYTGRTVRAALDALMDLGRPASIRLVVLVDRGHRELPIAPDYTGLLVETRENEEVRVNIRPRDNEDSVWLVEVER